MRDGRAKQILELVHWRERIKKHILKVEFCLQFAKDIKDVPPDIITQNDQFCKEVAKEKARREASKKPQGVEVNEPLRTRAPPRPQMPTVVGGVAVEQQFVEEQPAVSEDRAEAIRRCFQHLMATWDENSECAGTSSLPITADGRMCAEASCHSGYACPARASLRLPLSWVAYSAHPSSRVCLSSVRAWSSRLRQCCLHLRRHEAEARMCFLA